MKSFKSLTMIAALVLATPALAGNLCWSKPGAGSLPESMYFRVEMSEGSAQVKVIAIDDIEHEAPAYGGNSICADAGKTFFGASKTECTGSYAIDLVNGASGTLVDHEGKNVSLTCGFDAPPAVTRGFGY